MRQVGRGRRIGLAPRNAVTHLVARQAEAEHRRAGHDQVGIRNRFGPRRVSCQRLGARADALGDGPGDGRGVAPQRFIDNDSLSGISSHTPAQPPVLRADGDRNHLNTNHSGNSARTALPHRLAARFQAARPRRIKPFGTRQPDFGDQESGPQQRRPSPASAELHETPCVGGAR